MTGKGSETQGRISIRSDRLESFDQTNFDPRRVSMMHACVDLKAKKHQCKFPSTICRQKVPKQAPEQQNSSKQTKNPPPPPFNSPPPNPSYLHPAPLKSPSTHRPRPQNLPQRDQRRPSALHHFSCTRAASVFYNRSMYTSPVIIPVL